MNITKKREAHALDAISITETRDWKQKVQVWNGSLPFQDRISWLHQNHVREGNGPEQVIFYLEVADRYGESIFEGLRDHKKCLDTGEKYGTVATYKTLLSRKAFEILCTHCFGQEHPPYPYILPYIEPLFGKFLWFFRPYGGLGGYDNLRPRAFDTGTKGKYSHHLSVANKFAVNFAYDAWSLLNQSWNKCWETDPNPAVADVHWREIIMLVRRLRLLENMDSPSTAPNRLNFDRMVQMLFGEQDTSYSLGNLSDLQFIRRQIETQMTRGSGFAKDLYRILPFVKQNKSSHFSKKE
jgi:hypothetical protein